jgi:6-phosphogluconolactonase
VIAFVGSYGPPDSPTIHICSFDETTGELRPVGATDGITNPSFVTVCPSGRHLVAVSETGRGSHGARGSVHSFRIDEHAGTIELVPINLQPSGGDHPCHLRIDADGRWLAVSNYGSGSIAVLPIGAGGELGEIASSVQFDGAGPNPDRQDGPHAHATTFTPDGGFLVAADLGTDRLHVHAFDARIGSLRPHGEVAARPGAGPRHLAFHPDGSRLFVVNELDNTLSMYEWRAGTLDHRETVVTLPPGAPENIAADIRVAADGRHVYVSNRGHDSVAVFAVDGQRLERAAVRGCGGWWPRGLALAPGGRHLLTANERSDEVVVLPLLHGGSDVGAPVARVHISQPTCVALASARPLFVDDPPS